MLSGIMTDLGLASAILCFAVMLSFISFIIGYLWYLRRFLNRLERELARLREMLASGAGSGDIMAFLNSQSARYRIRLLKELIEMDCFKSKHPRLGDIMILAKETGLLSITRTVARTGDTWERAIAIRTLSVLEDRESIPFLAEVLDKTDFRPSVFAAAIGLARMGENSYAVKAMHKIYDKNAPNRDMLLAVLTEFGARESCIVTLLDDSTVSDDFKSAVADALGVQNVTSAVPVLEKLLIETSNSELKLHIIETLEKISTAPSCDIILKCIDDKDFRVRLKAVNALERLAGEKYIDVAVGMLSDKDIFVRRNAAEAVSRMGPAGAAKLEEIVKTGTEELRNLIKVILEEKKYKRVRWRFRYGESYT